MRTFADGTHGCPAAAAAIPCTAVDPMLADGKNMVCGQQGVAEVIVDDLREDEIENHAEPHESGKVGSFADNVALFSQVVDDRNENNGDKPDAKKESEEHRSMTEGVDGGMEVVLFPHLGVKTLKAAIESG